MAGEANKAAAVDSTAEEVAEEAIAESRAPGAELVARVDLPDDVFRVMDALDSEMVLDELSGRPSDKMVYSFDSGGKKQTGLSYAGVAETVRTTNAHGYTSIRVTDAPPIFAEVQEEDESGTLVTFIEALVYAEDAKTGGGNWGLARQAKFQTYRDAKKKPTLDRFAKTKALSKAQRNAMEPLTPLAFREEIIARYLGEPQRVLEIRRGLGVATAELPPALTDERANGLKQAVREVYREVREIDPMALAPGQFNVKLRRAEVEHEALEELLAEMQSRLAYMKEQAS